MTDGNYTTAARPSAAGADVAVVRVLVRDVAKPYNSKDVNTGDNPLLLNPLTGATWGAEDPCRMFPATNAVCSDGEYFGNGVTGPGTIFGGALPWEIGDISFTGMATAKSRSMYPTLADIKAIMTEIGDPKKVILSIYFRAPYVMDDASGLKNAGAILATFGVTDVAMMDVLSGKFKPQGKLPFALPKTLKAVQEQKTDLPGFEETDRRRTLQVWSRPDLLKPARCALTTPSAQARQPTCKRCLRWVDLHCEGCISNNQNIVLLFIEIEFRIGVESAPIESHRLSLVPGDNHPNETEQTP